MQPISFLAGEILLKLDNYIEVAAKDPSLITVERLNFRGNIQNNLEVFYNCHGSMTNNHGTILSNSTTHAVNPVNTTDSFINGAGGDVDRDVSTPDSSVYDDTEYDDQDVGTTYSSLNGINWVDDQDVTITDQDVSTTASSINTANGDEDQYVNTVDPFINLPANHASSTSTVGLMTFSLFLFIKLCLAALTMH